jgi:hypothetical protein
VFDAEAVVDHSIGHRVVVVGNHLHGVAAKVLTEAAVVIQWLNWRRLAAQRVRSSARDTDSMIIPFR